MNWEILLHYVNHQAGEEEVIKVENWLKQQPENKYLLNYLEKRSIQLNTPLTPADIDEQWLRLLDRIFEQTTTVVKPKNRYRTLSIAASILIVGIAASWYYVSQKALQSESVTLQTPANKHGKVTLPDGTTVYLSTNTMLSYHKSYGSDKREVALTGEAFFDVKHNAAKPFIVRTINREMVTVLGTSFNIYSRVKLNTEVKVATGLVGVTINKVTKFLKAGQQLVCNANGLTSITPVDAREAASLQRQTLVFNDDHAKAIALKIQRWYNVKVEVLPAANKHPAFSGEMNDAGLENLLNGLQFATGMHYRYKDPHTILLF